VSLQKTLTHVEAKDPSGHGSNLRHPFNLTSRQHEVFRPAVYARVEKAYKLPALPVNRPDITALRLVATHTGVAQVVLMGKSAVLLTDNVIDLAAVEGVLLRDQAILAEPFGTGNDQAPQSTLT